MTNKELLEKFKALVANERRAMRIVLEHIAEIEARKAYLTAGFDGIYSYLTKGLGYSEGAAHRRISASRILKSSPQIAEKIETGALNLTQLSSAAQLSRQTRTAISSELLTRLEEQPKAATEQILAETFQVAPKEHTVARTQRDHSVRLELTFTAEQFAELEKAKGYISHLCPEGSWPEVLTELACQYSKRFELKSKTQKKSHLSPSTSELSPPPPAGRQSVKGRRPIRITVKRQVFSRAGGCCQHVDPTTGQRCESRYQPQVDHVISVARGGSDELANLQLLCGRHNRAKADF